VNRKATTIPATTIPATSTAATTSTATRTSGVRVRMYRVGFGDFFLLTVPGRSGPAHILIDCGVHAANIASIGDCIQDLEKETGGNLALVILTHYHADHMSGFASSYDDFTTFTVGAVWITNRLDPNHPVNAKFMADLVSLAGQLKMQLAARTDEAGLQAANQVANAIGFDLGAAGGDDAGGGSNAKALTLLQSGFHNKPPVYYYQGGDIPTFPDELKGQITAQILGPAPVDSGSTFAATDDKQEQYLAIVAEFGMPDDSPVRPFEKTWPATAADYPPHAFSEFAMSDPPGSDDAPIGHAGLEATLRTMQPDVLAAAADALDGTLNNQSLVILFTVAGKKLLFVGDAQWGNWSSWLYGTAVSGADPGISAKARAILGSIDFYKVGHHGSTNANPIPAVGAISSTCSSMCSTASGAYGSPAKMTEVPRTTLLAALAKQTGDRLVRSDWVTAANAKPDPAAVALTPRLPPGFSSPGELYIDVVL
jgi:beta-lactamase superfamily II metal-dependent hydrolase